ncbi:MAG: LAGLIDADG family homing endonuclease [bacterium]|nr:LAGLIDADG family homing endonuclease [bacterium]
MGIKYFVNENFFKKWSKEMAYVLGLITADGSLEDASYLRGKYIRFSNTDKELVYLVKKYLESKHKIIKINPPNGKEHRKTRYFIRIGSHKLFNDLVSLGITPKKSLTMTLPRIPKKYFWHFTRGYMDGDGSVYVEKKKNRILLIFTSGSLKFLSELASEISKNTMVTDKPIFKGNRSFQLKYGMKNAMVILKEIYKDCAGKLLLARKHKVYKEFIRDKARWRSS